MGISPSGMQASAAVYNVDAVAKQPHYKRDDVVAPIEHGDKSAKSDLPPSKPARHHTGQHVDMRV
jgi:hypothetical protein